MFLFILNTVLATAIVKGDFNTSHVSIYPESSEKGTASKTFQYISYFYLSEAQFLDAFKAAIFQYISCFYLSYSEFIEVGIKHISIHLMFLFIKAGCLENDKIYGISIHPMFLFIKISLNLLRTISHFNTSHVSIYLNGKFHIRIIFIFQYIPCFYLSIGALTSMITEINFNTSHVSIYQPENSAVPKAFTNFNTSHVSIYPGVMSGKVIFPQNFNTSHVSIYQNWQQFHS